MRLDDCAVELSFDASVTASSTSSLYIVLGSFNKQMLAQISDASKAQTATGP